MAIDCHQVTVKYVRMRVSLILLVLVFSFSLSAFSETEIQTTKGRATYYHNRFHGRKCASGDVYDKNTLVAAHPTYPFGTFLRVTNLKNNKTVIVCVTDRCPPRKKRIIDLSEKAAKELDFIRAGVAEVTLEEVVGPADMLYLEPLDAGVVELIMDKDSKEATQKAFLAFENNQAAS